jgi:hypothetical protein
MFLCINLVSKENWGKMSATDTIFCRWELAVTDDIYIRNGSNIGAQTYNTYQNM